MKIFDNKKFYPVRNSPPQRSFGRTSAGAISNGIYLIGLAVVLAGFVFWASASPAEAAGLSSVALAKEEGCSNNEAGLSFSSFLNPLASLVEKVARDFGYRISLAASPDPDFCGSDSVGCSGTTPTATVSWVAAPSSYLEPGFTIPNPLRYYILTVSGVGSWNTGLNTSYTVGGLANNSLYNWSVEAYYWRWGYSSSASYGFTNRPYGSFTTPNCVPPPPTASISADSTSIAYNTATTIRWSSTDTTSCTISYPGDPNWATGTSGAKETGNLTSSQTYTVDCTGSGGSASKSVTVTVGGAPSASISADPTSVSYNTASTITWSSSNVTSCTIFYLDDPNWATGTSGSKSTGNLTSSQIYTVDCTGLGGSASASVAVSVGGAPTASISADSTSIAYNTATTIRWSSTNATSCTVSYPGDPNWATGTSDSKSTGNLISSKTYTLTCNSPGGSVAKSVTVNIVFLPCSDPSYPTGSWDRVWCNKGLTGKLADAPDQGTLQFNDDWGVGVVAGIRADDIGFKSGRKVNLSEGFYTFTLGSDDGSKLWIDDGLCIDQWWDQGYTERTCQKSLSSGNHDLRIDWYENGGGARASFSYTFVPPPGNFTLSTGGSVACNTAPLSWTAASGAQAYRILKGTPRVDISPYQPYTALNFTDTTVSQNTTYKYQIEAYNSAGTNRSNTINIDTPYCPPTLNFSSSATSIFQGQSVTLSWSTSYVTSCTASSNPTKSDWNGSKALNGSQVVVPLPPPSVTYNLTCSGLGGSTTQSVTINIAPLVLPDWREIIPR